MLGFNVHVVFAVLADEAGRVAASFTSSPFKSVCKLFGLSLLPVLGAFPTSFGHPQCISMSEYDVLFHALQSVFFFFANHVIFARRTSSGPFVFTKIPNQQRRLFNCSYDPGSQLACPQSHHVGLLELCCMPRCRFERCSAHCQEFLCIEPRWWESANI